MTDCPCCHGIGWTAARWLRHLPIHGPWPCGNPHRWPPVHLAGEWYRECPHCADTEHMTPPRTPEQTAAVIDGLAEHALARHFDDLGVHIAELRAHALLDRLERTLGTGLYADPHEH